MLYIKGGIKLTLVSFLLFTSNIWYNVTNASTNNDNIVNKQLDAHTANAEDGVFQQEKTDEYNKILESLPEELKNRDNIVIIRNKMYKHKQDVEKNKTILPQPLFTPSEILTAQEREKIGTAPLSKPQSEKTSNDDSWFHPAIGEIPNIYIAGSLGSNFGLPITSKGTFTEISATDRTNRSDFTSSVNYNPFITETIATGINFSDHIRSELEYKNITFFGGSNNVSNMLTITNGTTTKAFNTTDMGTLSSINGLNFNILLDTNRRNRFFFSIGAGVGFAILSFKKQTIQSNITFTYNFIAQFNMRLTNSLVAYVGYNYYLIQGRYYDLSSPIPVVNYSPSDTPALPDNRSLTQNTLGLDSFGIHAFTVGLRWYFM